MDFLFWLMGKTIKAGNTISLAILAIGLISLLYGLLASPIFTMMGAEQYGCLLCIMLIRKVSRK